MSTALVRGQGRQQQDPAPGPAARDLPRRGGDSRGLASSSQISYPARGAWPLL